MIPFLRKRSSTMVVAIAAALVLVASSVDARPGRGGGGFGSRGARTFQAPPATNTAPTTAAPIQRSATQPGTVASQGVGRAAVGAPGGFGRRGGFMGGFLGAGLIGGLLGYGLFAGFGGLASILGFMFQLALIAGLAFLAYRLFQRRFQPATAGAPSSMLNRDAAPRPAASQRAAGGGAGATRGSPIQVGPGDYDSFERLLGQVQTAYGSEDTETVRRHTTPEMAAYLEQELADNAARGVVNHVRDVKLLQGDLAEAWREGGTDYATVALRFGLVDHTVDRASGATVEGDPERATEATEVWTFRRDRGGEWALSAIQQG